MWVVGRVIISGGDINFTLPLKDSNTPEEEKDRHEQQIDPTRAKNIEKPALEELPRKYPKRFKLRRFLMELARINGYLIPFIRKQ